MLCHLTKRVTKKNEGHGVSWEDYVQPLMKIILKRSIWASCSRRCSQEKGKEEIYNASYSQVINSLVAVTQHLSKNNHSPPSSITSKEVGK